MKNRQVFRQVHNFCISSNYCLVFLYLIMQKAIYQYRAVSCDVMLSSNMAASMLKGNAIFMVCIASFDIMVSNSISMSFSIRGSSIHDDCMRAWCAWVPWISRSALRIPTAVLEDSRTSVKTLYKLDMKWLNVWGASVTSLTLANSVVDNLEPTEIIVSFSSLSKWFDPPADLPKTSHSSTREKDRQKDTESIAGSSSVADGELQAGNKFHWELRAISPPKMPKRSPRK